MNIYGKIILAAAFLVSTACTGTAVIDGNGLHDALEAAEDGQSIVLRKGTYDYYPESGTDMWLDPSGSSSGIKHVLFPIVGKKNLTVDGSGSRLVIHGDAFPFAVKDCRNITLKNFEIVTKYPSTISMKIEEKDKDGFSAKIIGDVCPLTTLPDGNVEFDLEGVSLSSRDGRISLHSVDRIAIQYVMSPGSKGDKDEFPAGFSGVRWNRPEEDLLRFDYYGDTHPKSMEVMYGIGENVVVNLEEKRSRACFFMENCEGINVKDVHIVRAGGMGLVAQQCGDITLDGLDIWPEIPGCVTTTADMMYFVSCFGKLHIMNCRQGFSLDDAMNVHGVYHRIESLDEGWLTLRAMHEAHAGFFPYRQGDSLEIIDAHTREVFARTAVKELVKDTDDPYVCRVRISGPDFTGEREELEGLLVENVTLYPEVLLEGNNFDTIPHCRLSGRGGITVRDNVFKNCYGAIYAYDLADYWYESGRISTLVIEDNEFIDPNGMGGDCVIDVGVSGWYGEGTPAVHDKVILKGNRIENLTGEFARISGVKDYTP